MWSTNTAFGIVALGGIVFLSAIHAQDWPTVPVPSPPSFAPAPFIQHSDELVAEVRIVGNERITQDKILGQLRTRPGRPFDSRTIEEDVRRLNLTGWFVTVRVYWQQRSDGRVVVFEVVERPTIQYVKYVGNESYPKNRLAQEAGIKPGDGFDLFAVEEARRRLESFYHSRGFAKARVTLAEGSQPTDAGVIFLIHEGPKQRILWTDFIGNTIASDAKLRTKIQSKQGFLWIFKGELDPEELERDRQRLVDYYRSLGFFRARIGRPLVEYNSSRSWARITFVIDEGPRYQIRQVRVVGNMVFAEEQLLPELKTGPGRYFNQAEMQADINTLQERYGSIGYVFADIRAEPRFLEEPALLDLVYTIQEGARCRVGRIDVAIKDPVGNMTHTQWTTVLNRLSLAPGDIVDIRELRASERRLKASGIFEVDPGRGISPKIVLVPPDADEVEAAIARQRAAGQIRGQSPESQSRVAFLPPWPNGSSLGKSVPQPQSLPLSSQIPGDPARCVDAPHAGFGEPHIEGGCSSSNAVNPGEQFVVLVVEGQLSANQSCDISRNATASELSETPSALLDPAIAVRQGSDPLGSSDPSRSSIGELEPVDQPAEGAGAAPSGAPQMRVPQEVIRGQYSPDSGVSLSPLRSRRPQTRTVSPGTFGTQGSASTDRNTGSATSPVVADPALRVNQPTPAVSLSAPATASNSQAVSSFGAGFPSASAPPAGYSAGNRLGGSGQSAGPGTGSFSTTPGNGGSLEGTSSEAGSSFYATPWTPPGQVSAPAAAGTASPANNGGTAWGGVPGGGTGTLPAGPSAPRAAGPAVPAPPLLGEPPDQDPFLYVPLQPEVQEARTGRIMLSAGINSDAGFIGSIIVDEQNFDWRRWPRSWQEIIDGTAFRGAGQRFRLEAVPGTEVQRYMASFQEPYWLNTNVSLGLSGFYYNRKYREWDEDRLGGRVAFGYQFTHDLSGTFAFRGANVKIYDPAVPPALVPELAEVVGSNTLLGFGVQLTHDTRDNAFLPTEGHLFEIGFEQVIGSFDYPRAEMDLRRYFLLREHPDGSGRHVLSLSGRVFYTGPNTPIYEHYFAGGYSTLRGFDFRGASPRDPATGLRVGGEFMLLASAEYMFPLTADDALRLVIFCDSGTVQPRIDDWTQRYRVAPGFGLRITIPAMGPAPIALDFAFPVSTEPGDEEEVFSFFLGFLR